jgi:chaperonin GroEL (HSP60 family)
MAEESRKAGSRFTTCRLPARFFRCMCRIEQTSQSEMSNAAIIVLADAEAVPVRTLADRLRMHPVDVVKDLRGRGYRLGSIRGAAGHWTMALKRNDAERYLAERREAGAP